MWLVLFISIWVRASDSANLAIEQAQALAVKKNRTEACAILREALKNTPAPAKTARVRLGEALHNLSRAFVTDKGQRAFEAGRALMFENPEIAMARFREALSLEDQNVSVLASLAKLNLFKDACDEALETIERARGVNPYAGDVAVLELRALLCLKRLQDFRDRARQLPSLDRHEEQAVQFFTAQSWLREKNPKKAAETLTRLTEEMPQFPDGFLALARAEAELGHENQRWLKRYVTLCKAVTASDRRRYSLEPRMCSEIKEVEDELAKRVPDV